MTWDHDLMHVSHLKDMALKLLLTNKTKLYINLYAISLVVHLSKFTAEKYFNDK